MRSASTISGRKFILLLFVCIAAFAGPPQTRPKPDTSPAKKKTAATTSANRPVSKASAHTRRTAVSHSQSAARVGTRKVMVTRKLVHGRWVRTTQIVRQPAGPSFQAHPDTERYQQIQQALAQKGYFKGEVNGQWNDDSVEALKRFQTDQKISNDGKISALSLIGLGLGPNRESASVQTNPTPPVAPSDKQDD